MWKRLKIIGVFLLLFALLLGCYSLAYGATVQDSKTPYVTLTSTEYTQLMMNLDALAKLSNEQQARMTMLEKQLQMASSTTSESSEALAQAKMQTEEQAKQLQTLNNLLAKQSKDLQQATNSLTNAEQSLKQLESELKAEQRKAKRNRVFALLAVVATAYVASR